MASSVINILASAAAATQLQEQETRGCKKETIALTIDCALANEEEGGGEKRSMDDMTHFSSAHRRKRARVLPTEGSPTAIDDRGILEMEELLHDNEMEELLHTEAAATRCTEAAVAPELVRCKKSALLLVASDGSGAVASVL